MGTSYSISVADWPTDLSRSELHRQIENCLEEINATFSTYRPQSELQKLNDAPGQTWISISPRLHFVLRAARRLTEETGGAFDITVAPLIELWQRRDKNANPTADEIESLLQLVGNDAWELRNEPRAVRKLSLDVKFNGNAIVPGYAIDCLAELLAAHRVKNFCIELGGEVRACGQGTQSGVGWWIALEQPSREHGNQSLIKLLLLDRAIATSGDYRQFFELQGKKRSHILDPRTGQTLPYRGMAVSVVAVDSLTADAWATALCVWGPEDGIRIANERQMPVCFVLPTNEPAQFAHQVSTRFQEQYGRYVAPALSMGNAERSTIRITFAHPATLCLVIFFSLLCGYYVFRRSRKLL
jgi:thiamine biosynthesis lipoprotein